MFNTELQNRDYVKIKTDKFWSYGGSQMWLAESGKGHDRAIADYGCGVVAAGDLFLYLAQQSPKNATPMTMRMAQSGALDKCDYLEYLKSVERTYGRVLNHIGMTGFRLASLINRYFITNRLCYSCTWKNMALNSSTARSEIKTMLENDIPVVISIPGVFFRSQALHLYRSPKIEMPSEKDRAYRFAAFGGHYITVTGFEQRADKTEVLTVSSWGKRYYIDLAEYSRAVHTLHGVLACGMVSVTPLASPKNPLKISVYI